MITNLNLQICPKCSDTKYIVKKQPFKSLNNSIIYNCIRCNFSWYTYETIYEI
jgi:DNA-directed RNA polymerase subunit M/transcription elongation factor TFIIS